MIKNWLLIFLLYCPFIEKIVKKIRKIKYERKLLLHSWIDNKLLFYLNLILILLVFYKLFILLIADSFSYYSLYHNENE